MTATQALPRRTRMAVAGAACALLALTACSGSTSGSPTATTPTSPPAAGAARIVIKNFLFSPATLTVAPGTVVTVKNDDPTPHTVTATASGPFDTGTIAGGKTATFTAPASAGTYDYICDIHQYMKGKLTVR